MSVLGSTAGSIFGSIFGATGDATGIDNTIVVLPTAAYLAAVNRFPEYVKNSPNVNAVVQVFADAGQDIEDAMQQLLNERSIAAGVGVQLDAIGVIVGQPRNDVSVDDDYRRYLSARIATNRSRGTVSDLTGITHSIVDDDDSTVVLTNEGPATAIVEIQDVAITDEIATVLIQFLLQAKVGGVRLLLRYSNSAPGNTFRLDSGPGLDVGHLARGIDRLGAV